MMSKRANEKVSEQLRRIIRDCGVSCYAIAKATRIDESQLSRFMNGERGLSMNGLDRLGEYLGLTIDATGPKEPTTKPTDKRSK